MARLFRMWPRHPMSRLDSHRTPDDEGENWQSQTPPRRPKRNIDEITVHAGPMYWALIIVIAVAAVALGGLGGWMIGQSKGMTKGRESGKAESHTVAYEEGKLAGFNAGRSNGLSAAQADRQQEGRNAGLIEGKKLGLEEGRKLGFEEGFTKGRTEGYAAGLKAAPAIWTPEQAQAVTQAVKTRLEEIRRGPEWIVAKKNFLVDVERTVTERGLVLNSTKTLLFRFGDNSVTYVLRKTGEEQWPVSTDRTAKRVAIIVPRPQPKHEEFRYDSYPKVWRPTGWSEVNQQDKVENDALISARSMVKDKMAVQSRLTDPMAAVSQDTRLLLTKSLAATLESLKIEAFLDIQFAD